MSEWTINNFLFLGKPLKVQHVLKRYLRRTPNPENTLDKPIIRTSDIRNVELHHNELSRSISMDANSGEIVMNHYWGARLQNLGDDTKEILAKTIPDYSMITLVDKFEEIRLTDFITGTNC